jgi:hypothetical protein
MSWLVFRLTHLAADKMWRPVPWPVQGSVVELEPTVRSKSDQLP